MIEGWTVGNSGLSDIAENWNVGMIPLARNEPNPTEKVIQSLEVTRGGFCDFVALPWYQADARLYFDRTARNAAFTPIAALDQRIDGSKDCAVAPAAVTADRVAAISAQLKKGCENNSFQRRMFDCTCAAQKLADGLRAGTISAAPDDYSIGAEYMNGDHDPVCVNVAGVTEHMKKQCDRRASAGQPSKTNCQCETEQAIANLRADPNLRQATGSKNYAVRALLVCN